MKVAYMLGSLNRGGTETLMLNLFEEKKNIPFNIIAIYRKSGDLEHEFESTQVPFYKLSPKSKFDISYILKLRKLIKNQQITIIHAQQPLDLFYAYYACLGLKVKLILTFHGFEFNDGKLANRILKFVIRKTDINIFVSNYLKNYYLEKYQLEATRQKLVYNGIGVKTNFASKSAIREEIYLQKNEFLFAMVGNFVAVRNQLFICQFLKLLNENKLPFKFLFIGKKDANNPDLFDKCVNFCAQNDLNEKVFFLSSRSDVKVILPELDAFIYATNHDTFSLAIVEAICAEIPVFANDWEVINEISENGLLLNLYKTGDVRDLEEKFSVFLAQIENYRIQSKVNAGLAKQKYSIEKHIENLFIEYSNLL
jgi:glycosyltransferase involved in cell wall biosynthesis